jgi:hypothetical protein
MVSGYVYITHPSVRASICRRRGSDSESTLGVSQSTNSKTGFIATLGRAPRVPDRIVNFLVTA